jgi:hypothetical protein
VKQTTQYHTEEYKGIELEHCIRICNGHTVRTCYAWGYHSREGRIYYRFKNPVTFYWVLSINNIDVLYRFAPDTEPEYRYMVERLKEEVT